MSLTGRSYVVTGSASGIGAATRRLLEARGASVVGVDLHDAEVTADLARPADREALPEQVRERTSRVDAVIACAGLRGSGAAHPPDAIVRVNYFGAVTTLAGLRPLLAESSAPRAATIASIAALRDWVDEAVAACLDGDEQRAVELCRDSVAAYASSKRALARYVRRAAPQPDWGGAGIPINAVAPGVIETPMTIDRLSDPEQRRILMEKNPQALGIGRPEDVAELLIWLTSPGNRLVTGQIVFVDGGYEATLRGDDVP